MKRLLSIILALLMLIPMALSALPQLSFADATQLVETTDGYAGSIYYNKGIRKKSDGSILFCPFLSELRARVDAKEVSLSDYTIEMTFSLLTGENGTVVHTFNTVHAAINSSNGYYQDIYLNGSKGNCGFCPTAGCWYDVEVNIYTGFGTEAQTLAYYGTYKNAYADTAISSSTYYAPTSVPTDAVQITETTEGYEGKLGYGDIIRKKGSNSAVLFSPYITELRTAVGSAQPEGYTAKLTFTLLEGEGGAVVREFDPVSASLVNGTGYFDITLQGEGVDCGFCPTAGCYYDIAVSIIKDGKEAFYGTYKNIKAGDAIADSPYYAPTPTKVQITETRDDYTGTQLYKNGIRKNSAGTIMLSAFMTEVRAEVNAGKSATDFTVKTTFHALDDDKSVLASFPVTLTPNATSNGAYFDIPLKGCGFCPTAGMYYDIEVEVYEGDTLKYFGTYKNIVALDDISGSADYQPTAIPGKPADYDISLSYSFNNDLAGSAAGNIYFTVDKAGYFEFRWADAEGKPLTATVGEKTLPYSPLFKLSVSEKTGATHAEKIIGFTAIPQGAAKLIVTDSAQNVLENLDIPANKLLASEEYEYSFGAISDLHYEYFIDKVTGDDWAIYCVDTAVDFYEAVGAKLILATGDYSKYTEETAYQKYQTSISKSTIPVLACGGNHEVYPGCKTGDEMFGEGGYWRTYMNNGFYDGTVEGVLDIAENGVDIAYSYPGLEDYVYISLNQWYWDGHTDKQESLITDSQVAWLTEQLEAYKDKTVYLIFHTYLGDDDYETLDGQGDMISGGGYTYGGFWNQYTDDEKAFRALLEKYDNVLWFNGHSHYEYSTQRYNENLNIYDYLGTSATMIHVPSVTNMRAVNDTDSRYSDMYGTASQGALMFVYGDYQIMNGVDLWGEEILSYACYIVYDDKTETGTIEGTDITWTYDKQLCSLRFDGTGEIPAVAEDGTAAYAQYADKALTVYVAEGITAVGKGAFKGFAKLKTVALKDDVKTIGESAFEGTAIESLTLPEGLETVCANAFAGVTTKITITYYGSSKTWTTITVEAGSEEALENATVLCRKHVVTFIVGDNSTDTEWKDRTVPSYSGKPTLEHEDPNKFYVFKGWSDGTTTYAPGKELPKATMSVTYTAVFEESTEERVVGNTVGNITWSLDRFTGILTVSGSGMTPSWISTAKGEWHKYASEIYEVIVEEGITGLGTFAFSSIANLEKVTLPKGLTTLCADAFSYNANLKTLVLPATVKTIGQGVTYSTNNIETIYYGACAEAWKALVAGITTSYNDSLKGASPVFDHECAPGYECTDAKHTLVCGTCGFVLEKAADHSFGDWTVTEEPEIGKLGKKEQTCGTCGHTVSEPIDALPEPEPDPDLPPAAGDKTALFALVALISTAALCLGAKLFKKEDAQ